jgi:PAS domain S-box-containing protein
MGLPCAEPHLSAACSRAERELLGAPLGERGSPQPIGPAYMTQAHAPAELRGWRVVLVDDSPDERAMARRLLLRGSDRRYAITEADSGAAAVRAVLDPEAGVPDCLLLDYDLPDMDALEVLTALRGPDGTLCCPVVVFTGHAALDAGRELIRAGAEDYIGKDWLSAPALTRVMENAVERWAMARELEQRGLALRASEANHRRLLQAAREAEARLRLALEASNTGIWTWQVSADSVTWSSGSQAIHGHTNDELESTGAAFLQQIHPEDRADVQLKVQTAIAERSLCQCAFRILRPNGDVVSVESLGRATYDALGQPLQMIGTVTDVSARKRVEGELAQSEERLARAQRAARIGTWDWNVITGEASWTEEAWRLFGHVPFSCPVSYELWLSSIHPEDRDVAASTVRESFRTGSYRHEFRVNPLPLDGTIRWLESSGEALSGADGQPARMLGTVRDATERHQAEQSLLTALDQAERAVGARDQLVALVSHDLKSPLGTMMFGVELLRAQMGARGQSLGSKELSTLERLDKQIRRMDMLVDELLDVGRLHAGKPLELALKDTDLVQLTRDLVEEQQRAAPRHRIEMRVASDDLHGYWDTRRLQRVVSNLLSNAVKYSPAGGRVQVTLERAQVEDTALALLRIEDEGIGIAPDELTRIFDWFSRAENARQSGIPGTGIGLAGAREIVTQHGGSISVESTEGRGSTFTVSLPTRAPEAMLPTSWAPRHRDATA